MSRAVRLWKSAVTGGNFSNIVSPSARVIHSTRAEGATRLLVMYPRQQNDDRERNSEHPEQYAASHDVLLSLNLLARRTHEMAEIDVLIAVSSAQPRRAPCRRRA
jgi:hypothetical protein